MYIKTSRIFTGLVSRLISSRNMSRDTDIGAPVGGECEYEGFILDNGMKVILIRSEKFTSCGATLAIKIGHNNVPHRIFGFLHLMEHVILCNMRRQDKQKKFGFILDQYGGQVNAITYPYITTYFYKTQFISPSLELFAQEIFKPYFDDESIAAEIENVDSEYIIDSTDDMKCLREFRNARWYPDELDKYSGFEGNKYTLQARFEKHVIDMKIELEQFHKRYFSTNLMSLIVFANDDMDTLKNLVIQIFATKKKKIIDSLPEISPDVSIKNYRTKWSIIPTQHDKLLKILFPFSMSYFDFGFMPLNYIGIMLKHEENGSLLSYLKEWCWCTTITFENIYLGKTGTDFILTFNLTQQGLDHIDDIIDLVFQYVYTLQSFVKYYGLTDEFSVMMMYRHFPPSAEYVQDKNEEIAHHIYLSTFTHVLKRIYYVEFPIEFREATRRIIGVPFKPYKIIVCVMSKNEETNATSPSQIKFKVDKLPPDRILKWTQNYNNNFEHPHITELVRNLMDTYDTSNLMNSYEEFAEFEEFEEYEDVSEHPQRISTINELTMFFHYVKSNPFEMYLQLISKEAYCDAKSCNLNNMLAYVLRDSLSEKLYSAALVGINCQIESNMFGIRVIIQHYRYKRELVDVLLAEIMSVMQANERIDDSRFEMLKEQYITYLKNLTSATPRDLAFYYLEILVAKRIYTYEELLNEIADLSLDALNQFINKFYNTKFMKCLIRGDMTFSEAYDVRNYLELDCRNSTEFEYHQPDLATDIKLEIECNYLYTTNNVIHKSSCILVYHQFNETFTNPNDSIKHLYILRIINAMIQEHCFDELRRKAHLGYIAQSEVIRINDTCGLAIYVVGHSYETEYVEEQIDDFMEKMLHKIYNTYEDVFDNYIMKSQNYGRYTMLPLVSRYFTNDTSWEQILLFSDHNKEDFVYSASVQEFAEIFKKMIDPETRRKLSVHIKSEINKPAGQQKATTVTRRKSKETITKKMRKNKPTIIENIADFKSKY